jgi:signal transduction histidine kinase
MHPDPTALTNGNLPLALRVATRRTELDTLRATCRRQALVIDSLREAAAALRRGALALKAENAELRVVHGETIEVHLALDVQAPGAARSFVADALRPVAPSLLDDALLLVSELVTNSVRHSGAPAGERVVVRVELRPGMLRLEVENPGGGGDTQIGGGFGLTLVQVLSERWGVERVARGGTRIWAQLARAA